MGDGGAAIIVKALRAAALARGARELEDLFYSPLQVFVRAVFLATALSYRLYLRRASLLDPLFLASLIPFYFSRSALSLLFFDSPSYFTLAAASFHSSAARGTPANAKCMTSRSLMQCIRVYMRRRNQL